MTARTSASATFDMQWIHIENKRFKQYNFYILTVVRSAVDLRIFRFIKKEPQIYYLHPTLTAFQKITKLL